MYSDKLTALKGNAPKELYLKMNETWQERGWHRQQIIREAVGTANRIIMDGSDGSVEETNRLTGELAIKFLLMTLGPLKVRTNSFLIGKEPNDNIPVRVVEAMEEIIQKGFNGSQEETNYLRAGIARELTESALHPFGAAMLKKDMMNHYEKEG
jgi:hypothetical protein